MDDYSPRQLCALLTAALSAPLALVCSPAGWQWVLLAAAVAGALLYYIEGLSGSLPPREGYVEVLKTAFGKAAPAALGLYWLWLVLSLGLTAGMAVGAFPQDRAFPLVPLVLLALAALVCRKGPAAVCRFGGTLFLVVAALMGFTLAFGAADLRWENLRPAGSAVEAVGPLTILLLPAAGLFLRDRLRGRGSGWRWYLLTAGLAAAISAVTMGALGRTLAQAAPSPFWLMSRSISVFGVMERFEAVISSLLAVGFCCLMALLLSAGQKALCGAAPGLRDQTALWITAVPAAGAMWAAGCLPGWIWPVGNLLFWAFIPVLTLGIVRQKIFQKN